MPVQKRFKTNYPGVYYVEGTAVGTGRPEKIYYVRYRKNGKLIEEKAGRQYQNDMTPSRAAGLRTRRIEGELSNKEKRDSLEAEKKAKESRKTIDRLWAFYIETLTNSRTRGSDENRYNKYLKDQFGNKEPQELIMLDVDRLRLKLLKTLSPQSVKHVLTLLARIVNFGVKRNLCHPLPFHIKKPTVNNLKTEDLNAEQLHNLLKAIETDGNEHARGIMKLALFTGMRKGEIFKLKWDDIDFERGFITIRNPKGGINQKIPLNEAARTLLQELPKEKSEFIFPGRGGGQRTTIKKPANRIKKRAGLPKDFRPLHGLRHVYASMLASSGQVDMYVLQKLLTHKDGKMTQRYAHLRDETLRRASEVAGTIIEQAAKSQEGKVVNLKGHK
ncbi:MAG: site-specific integrase [Deltaproteobacteria bacterium]|nr:site-specific integrase [Deltaproteobacteria bacterium]